jgi:hypothetical protein
VTAAPTTLRSRGLSCYTESLAAYLAGEWDTADEIVARSVRLAVSAASPSGRLAFSHHDPPLDRLPDDTYLRYAGAPTAEAALEGVAEELSGRGRAVVVVDNARLPWSPAYESRSAPHWLLVDERRGDEWHVVDGFSGLLPSGEQVPYEGWLETPALRTAMTLPRWTPEQEQRNRLVFGAPVPVPESSASLWLRRERGVGGARAGLGDGWLLDDRETLRFLADYAAGDGARGDAYLEDVWAAVGHRAFAYGRRLAADDLDEGRREALQTAKERWEDLPRLLRFAADSGQRSRPRPTLVHAAFDRVLQAEEDLA